MNVERESPQSPRHRRRVAIGRAMSMVAPIAALAPLFAAAPALAQEERSQAPSLPDSGGDEAPAAAAPDRLQMLEERMNALNLQLRQSEELRQKSISPLSWNGYVDFGFFVPLGNGGAGWVRDTGPMR